MIEIEKYVKNEPYPFKFFIIFLTIFAFYFLIGLKFSFPLASLILFIPLFLVVPGYYFFKEPGIGISLMIAATSLDVIGRLTPEGSATITFFHIFVFITFFAFILKKIYLGQLDLKQTNIDSLLLLLLVMIGISLFYSPNRLEGFIYWLRVFALIIVMHITVNVMDNQRVLVLAIIATFLSSLILSIMATHQLMTTSSLSIFNALHALKLFNRFGITFENPNYFATFLLFPFMIGGALLLYLKMNIKKKIFLLILPLSIMAIAFVGTFSRSAWVALVVGIIYLIYFSKYRRQIAFGLLLSSIIMVIFLYQTAFLQSFIFRFATIFEGNADPSSLTRVHLVKGGIEMAFDTHLIGVGFRGFPIIYRTFHMPASQLLDSVYESHTSIIEIFAELGIVGLVLFALIFIRYFRFGINSIRSIDNNFLKACQIGTVGFVLTFFINYLFSGGILTGNLMWVAFGQTYAIDYISRSLKRHEQYAVLP